MMAYQLLFGSLFYFVSGRTSLSTEISVTVLSELPETKSATTTSSPDQSSTVTAGRTSLSTEISVSVLSELPETKSATTTSSPDQSSTVTAGISTPQDCRLPGFLYKGTKRVTKSGLLCQRWDMQSPHEQNYFMFSLAQENFCRNFDREEPWCFTNNSSIRWELCGVDVCFSPCLNQSIGTKQIASECFAAEPTGNEFCSRFWRTVGCLKRRIESFTKIPCSGIELKSIALQRQDILERVMGRSISQCIKAPCTDSRVLTIEGLVTYGGPCNLLYPLERSNSETLCRNFQRVANCIVSKLNDETNSTCLTKDKVSTARKFASRMPQDAANVSLCISKISEFPVSKEDSADSPSVDQDITGNLDQTQLFIAIGSTIVLLFVGILIFSLIAMRKMLLRKRRRELMRLPSVPKTASSPYESKFTLSNDPYNDPDYDIVEEQDEVYEELREPMEENETQIDKERMSTGSYLDPQNLGSYLDPQNLGSYLDPQSLGSYLDPQNLGSYLDPQSLGSYLDPQNLGSYLDPQNLEGNYLEVVHSSKDKCNISYMNVNPYRELIDDSVEKTATTYVNDEVQENEEYSYSP